MSVYDLKVKRLALLLLPTFYRRPLVAAFAQCLVQGVNRIYGDFMKWHRDEDYRLNHNGQVCYLRAVLNDSFDPIQRRILVEDEWSGTIQGQCAFCREVDRPISVPLRSAGVPFILNRRGFGGASGYDFWVTVPRQLRGVLSETRLDAVVNTYKLASRRWTINYE